MVQDDDRNWNEGKVYDYGYFLGYLLLNNKSFNFFTWCWLCRQPLQFILYINSYICQREKVYKFHLIPKFKIFWQILFWRFRLLLGELENESWHSEWIYPNWIVFIKFSHLPKVAYWLKYSLQPCLSSTIRLGPRWASSIRMAIMQLWPSHRFQISPFVSVLFFYWNLKNKNDIYKS